MHACQAGIISMEWGAVLMLMLMLYSLFIRSDSYFDYCCVRWRCFAPFPSNRTKSSRTKETQLNRWLALQFMCVSLLPSYQNATDCASVLLLKQLNLWQGVTPFTFMVFVLPCYSWFWCTNTVTTPKHTRTHKHTQCIQTLSSSWQVNE